jgi:hypothetical protein
MEALCFSKMLARSQNTTLHNSDDHLPTLALPQKLKSYLNLDIWLPDSEVILCEVFIVGIVHSCHTGNIEGTLVHQPLVVLII